MKVIADEKIIVLRRNLSERVERLRESQRWRQDELGDDFHAGVIIANLFEAMAAGINTKVFDEDVCYKILGPEAVHVCDGMHALLLDDSVSHHTLRPEVSSCKSL